MSGKRTQSHGGIHSLSMACYHAAHDYKPGGLPMVAQLVGIEAGTLRKKLDWAQPTHILSADDLQKILHVTRDQRILDTFNSDVGAVWFWPEQVPECAADLDVLASGNALLINATAVITELGSALANGDISKTERARLNKRFMELQQSLVMIDELAKQFEVHV